VPWASLTTITQNWCLGLLLQPLLKTGALGFSYSHYSKLVPWASLTAITQNWCLGLLLQPLLKIRNPIIMH